jgi:hypothetical protein
MYRIAVSLTLLLTACTAQLPPAPDGRDDVVTPPYVPLHRPPVPDQELNGTIPPVGQGCVYWGDTPATTGEVVACDFGVGLDCGCDGVGGTPGCEAPAPTCKGLGLGGCCVIVFQGQTTEACFPQRTPGVVTEPDGGKIDYDHDLSLAQDKANCEGAWGGTWTTTIP